MDLITTPTQRVLAALGLFGVLLALIGLTSADPKLLITGVDDDPWGNIARLSRSGAVLWLVASGALVAAAVAKNKMVNFAAMAAWAVVGLLSLIGLGVEPDSFGLGRPSNLSWVLAALIALGVATFIDGSADDDPVGQN